LETVLVGGIRCTTRSAIRAMIANANPSVVPAISPRERQKQIREAEHRLEMAGV